jgi:hypothetical protein
MGNDDRIVEIHKTLGEVSSDIKWIVQSRKEDLERIYKYNDNKRTFRTCAAIIGIPIIISVGVFAMHVAKNVDILCALHKPQMAIFSVGGTLADPLDQHHSPAVGNKR